jgi:hypothetical protein
MSQNWQGESASVERRSEKHWLISRARGLYKRQIADFVFPAEGIGNS